MWLQTIWISSRWFLNSFVNSHCNSSFPKSKTNYFDASCPWFCPYDYSGRRQNGVTPHGGMKWVVCENFFIFNGFRAFYYVLWISNNISKNLAIQIGIYRTAWSAKREPSPSGEGGFKFAQRRANLKTDEGKNRQGNPSSVKNQRFLTAINQGMIATGNH